jgi:hypothetical protein
LPLFWSSTGVAMQPAASTTTLASTWKRWLARPEKGATTRPTTPVARAPCARTSSTRTEVSTRAPAAIAAGTYETSIDCLARLRQPVKHSPLPRQPRTLRGIDSAG